MLGGLFSAATGASLGTLFVKLTADSTNLVKGMSQAQLSVERSSAAMLASAGSLALGMTAAFAVVGVVGVREAMKFEDSFAGVRKTVNATELEFAKLEESFRNMAKQMPINVNEINRVAEAAGQLGIKKENIVEFTKTMSMLGVTTNLSADEAATSLARIANITQMSQKEFSNLGSTIVALGNDGASTEKEITEMALRIAGAGKTVGMSVPQILSFANALSSVGIEAEAGGTAISQTMIRMAKAVATGSDELELFAGAAGMSGAAFQKAFKEDAAGAVLKFMEGLKSMSDAGVDVFSFLDKAGLDGIRLTDAMLRASNAGDLFRKSLELGSKAWQENNALQTEAEKRFNTFSSQLTITWNLIKDYLITIGQELVPVLKVLNQMLQEGLKGNGEFGRSFETFVKDIAPAVITMIGLIGDAIWGWKLIIKSGQMSFLGYGAAILTIFDNVLKGVKIIVENMVNAPIKAINAVIGAVNNLLDPLGAVGLGGHKAMIPTIKFKLDVDTSSVTDMAASFREAAQETLGELQEMAGEGGFSDRLDAKFKAVSKSVVTENKKIVDSVGATVAKVKELTQMDKDSAKAMSIMGGIGMPDPIKQAGFALEDPRFEQLQAMSKEEDTAKAQLAKIEELNNAELQLNEEAQAKKIAMLEAYNDKVKMLQMAQAEIVLGASAGMFDSLTEIAEATAGKQSGIYKAMFAASKAFAIAEAVVKIQQGIAAAAANSFPYNIIAMASVAAATSSIVSTIQSAKLTFGGAREMGGPVQANKTFLVGEAGPELFTPSGNGNITPNDALGGKPSNVKVIINNYTDATAEVSERQDDSGKVIEVMIKRVKGELASEVRDGRGDVNRALTETFNLRRGK